MKHSDKLFDRYCAEIAAWNWQSLEDEALNWPQVDECGDVVARAFLGSVTALYPSGKIYAPWTTNQTARDMIRDQAYSQSLEQELGNHGYYLEEHGDDLFACKCLDPAGEFFYSDNEGFYRDGERVADSEAELNALMESEGYFPNVYYLDGYGDLAGFYEFESK